MVIVASPTQWTLAETNFLGDGSDRESSPGVEVHRVTG